MPEAKTPPRDAPDPGRLLRLLKLSLALNGLVLLVNLGLFYALLVFVVREPAQLQDLQPVNPAPVPSDEEYKEELAEFFHRTADLLDRAARKHGANPAEFLPTRQEIEAAVETRTIHSDESQAVLEKLREGYDYFDLDWPIVVPRR